jgi:hypothetical protein
MTTEAAVMVTSNYPKLKAINFRGIPLGKYEYVHIFPSFWVFLCGDYFHSSLHLLRLGECKCLEEIDFTNTYIDDSIMYLAFHLPSFSVSWSSSISSLLAFNALIL